MFGSGSTALLLLESLPSRAPRHTHTKTDGGKEGEYKRILSACTSMSADSHTPPIPAAQTGMKQPPAVTELTGNAAVAGWGATPSPSAPPSTRIWLVSAPINNQATINRAINSYCNTLIYSVTQGSSVITASIYINTICTRTCTLCLQHTHAHWCVCFSGL